MIQITRAQARLIRAVLRKSAPIGTARNYRPPLALHTGEDGLRVRIHAAEVAVEWHNPGPRPPDEIVLPGQALDDFEGAKDRTITQPRWEGKTMTGHDYLLEHALPNFYFHLTHVYALLRHNGVSLGKRDFLGALTQRAP